MDINKYLNDYIREYISETIEISKQIDKEAIVKLSEMIVALKKDGGRLFILGIGGSAANASHAVNDFRKICGIETYAPTDNMAEITARTNDDGWEATFDSWLKVSRLNEKDIIMVLSVSGGSETQSGNITNAIKYSKEVGSKVISIVPTSGGYASKNSDLCVFIPVVNKNRNTPHAEGFQGIIWHMVVNAIAGVK